MTLAVLILALVTVQRLVELLLARRNTAALRARGAYEVDGRHYPLIVALHAGWLAGLWALAVWRGSMPVDPLWISLFVILQVLRLWVIATLGSRWTTRIMVVPEAPLVTGGPYRFLAHPNYCIVAAEILVLPLAFGLFWYGVAFSVLNGLVLWRRVRIENKALAGPQ